MNRLYIKNILRHNYVRLGISLCLFLWIIFSLPFHTSKISLHIDEIAWFIDTDAFEQLFLKRDISSSFWQSPQRYDQPPLVKYIYGAYLWIKAPNVFTNRERLEEEWGRWGIYTNPKTTETGFEVFAPYIHMMRRVNLVALIGALCAFYLLLILIVNVHVLIAVLGVVMLSRNELFVQEMTHATHDGFMLCFMLFSLLFYCLYLKYKQLFWLAVAIMCGVFSAASKLTGVLVIISICMHQTLGILIQGKNKKRSIFRFISIVFAIFVLWALVNPTLYKDPIRNTQKYFSFRAAQTYQLQAAYPSAALTNFSTKIRASWCTTVSVACQGFFEKGTVTPINWINVSVLVVGLFHVMYILYFDMRNEYMRILGIFLFLAIVWNTALLPMHYGRYYLPTQIGIFFLSVCGIEGLRVVLYGIVKKIKPPSFDGGFLIKRLNKK